MLLVAIIDQRVQAVDADRDHIAAPPAITAVGAAELDIGLAAETGRAAAAITALDMNLGLIEELHRCRPLSKTGFRLPLGSGDLSPGLG